MQKIDCPGHFHIIEGSNSTFDLCSLLQNRTKVLWLKTHFLYNELNSM